jgi:hypothetical protein
MNKILIFLFITFFICGCGDSRSRVLKNMQDKEIFLNLPNDSDLIGPELLMYLTEKGFKVSTSLSESNKLQTVTSSGVATTARVSNSNARYEVQIVYSIQMDRITAYNLIIRDRNDESLIATSKYRWNRVLPAPTIDEGVALISDFIVSVYK